MNNCDICYSPIRNIVTLECKHCFCLKCVVNYLKANDECLSCPMCRRSYHDIYFKKTFDLVSDTSIEIDIEIYQLPYHELIDLILNQNPGKRVSCYRTNISKENIEEVLDIFIIDSLQDDLIFEQQLLERFLLQALVNEVPFKEHTQKQGRFELTNSETFCDNALVLVLRQF
jgi:hypothetical protein